MELSTMDPQLAGVAAELNDIAARSDVQIERFTQIKKISSSLVSALIAGHWYQVLADLQAASKSHLVGDPVFAVSQEGFDMLWQRAREETDRLRRRYPSLFEHECTEQSFVLDRDSRHPKYTSDGHFLQASVDEGAGLATISTAAGSKPVQLPMDPAVVVARLVEERRRLYDRKFKPEEFLKGLQSDYRAIIGKSRGTTYGSAVPIREITKRRGKNIAGFKVDEFAVDLWKLMQSRVEVYKGERLRLDVTKDSRAGMFLPFANSYVGYLAFQRN